MDCTTGLLTPVDAAVEVSFIIQECLTGSSSRMFYNQEEHLRMPSVGKRIQKRSPTNVALQISSAKQPLTAELAFAENISLHGVRIVTKRAWKPEERVLLKSRHGSIQSRAKVIYCYQLGEGRYAVGLELFLPVGTWVDVSNPARLEL
jgi:hypothetical protein